MPDRSVALNIAAGIGAGLAATYAMGKTTTYLYENESQQARRREDEARGGATAYATAARKIAGSFGRDLSPDASKRYGQLLHWGIGASSGLAYAFVRSRIGGRRATKGLLFGLGLFAVMDEAVNYLFGLTPGPTAFPWQAHARGLAGHLVFGSVAEATLDLVDLAA